MVVPVLLLTLGVAAVFIGSRRRQRRRVPASANSVSSPVAYQHLQLYHGGLISQSALEAAKAELEDKLAHGGARAVETCLRAGLEYVVKVRALSEIGTAEAARALERQLARRISDDPIEQSWYWLDLAQALRGLNRGESLPALFACAEKALTSPLGHPFAAELLAFPQFGDYLTEPRAAEGQAALRVLTVAMEGIRRGYVPVALYADAQLGDLIRRLAECCPGQADPVLARTFLEALRHARRSYVSAPELRDDAARRQAVRRQAAALRDAEPILCEYLHGIGEDLADSLLHATPKQQADILRVIAELRADAGEALRSALDRRGFSRRAEAIACLQWSPAPESSAVLGELVRSAVAGRKPAWWKRHATPSALPLPELLAALVALRGHAGERSELLLCEFARHPQPQLRIAAFQSLGWWEPVHRARVIDSLNAGRIDGREEVRMAAIAALARLGECAALQVLREMLTNESPEVVHQAIDIIAVEGLTWLWPELDLLTETEDPAVAHHAWEAIEGLRESIVGALA
jgi:HEAT repeat protein